MAWDWRQRLCDRTWMLVPLIPEACLSPHCRHVARQLRGMTNRRSGYLAHLLTIPRRTGRLLEEVLRHHTGFFRDPAGAEQWLRRDLPAPLCIWVPACASGEEAYTYAILLIESGQPKAKILATDPNRTMLATASAGCYTDDAMAAVSVTRRQRFFVPYDSIWRVRDEIRHLCRFEPHDLRTAPPATGFHLISCRNVLSHFFTPPTLRAIWEGFHQALLPDGYLLLGRYEWLDVPADLFCPINRRLRLYARR